ncbi:MAG: response regulator [Clostridia bacterium]|nr:response regulator [Clostridia bacterium]
MYSILHLDKSGLIKQMVKSILVERGFNYTPVESAREAYSILAKEKIDLIITSMLISDDTIENFIKTVNQGMNKDTPIFVVTGSTLDEDKKKVINLGVSDYISKDNLVNEVLKHIECVIKQSELMKYLREAHIAVVDDSKLDREFVKSILSKNNVLKVDSFNSGNELLESGIQYDIYILDAVLKDEFGNGLIMQIRRNNINASIIVVSSLTNTKTIASIMDAGADDYIYKPIDENILIAKLKSHVRAYALLKKIQNAYPGMIEKL